MTTKADKIGMIYDIIHHGPGEYSGIVYQGKKIRKVWIVYTDAAGNETSPDPDYPDKVDQDKDLIFTFETVKP